MVMAKDLSKMKFDMLQPKICVGSNSRKNRMWECECDCGNKCIRSSDKLIRNMATSCGCKHAIKFVGNVSSSVWNQIKQSIKSRKPKLLISIEEADRIYTEQDGICNISGIPIKLSKKLKDCTASLDRIDSRYDYTKENCQWVLREINYMKGSLEQDYFIYLCSKISNFDGIFYSSTFNTNDYIGVSNIKCSTGYMGITGSVWSEVANTKKHFNINVKQGWNFLKNKKECAP